MMWNTLVSLRNSKNIKKSKHVCFYIAYILYFVSWIFGDLPPGLAWLTSLEKIMRYPSYFIMVACLFVIRRDRKEWLIFFIMGSIGAYYFLISKELYVFSLTLLVMISMDEDVLTIFKVSLGLLCFMVIATLVLCMTGVLENVVTARGLSDPTPRYSLGFYHSNVLPLLLFYILAFLGVIYNLRLNRWILLAFAAVSVAVYVVCNSRSSFLMTLALIGLYAIYPHLCVSPGAQDMIYRISRKIIFLLTVLTVVLVLLQPMNIELIHTVDNILSGRITLGYQKMLNCGIRFLSPKTAADYIADGIVLDNAYISAIIRYGWISVAVLSTINYYCCEKYKKHSGALLIFICVCIGNFVDNDLLTYSCYPFLLAAFNKKEQYRFLQKRLDRKELVSVIMSTYNECEHQLSASIESILKQSYKNIEFVIVNDNPQNEQLRQVLAKYAAMDKRIVLVENSKNMGLVNSLNKAISCARGSYFARMDADDIAKADRIMLQMRYLKNNALDFVGGHIHFIDEEDRSLGNTMKVPATHEQICRGIRWGNCIPHPTWLLKREVYETLGGYRQIPHAEDYDFILRALKAGYRLGNVPYVLLNYRIRASGISVSNSLEQNMIRNYLATNRMNIFKITEEMVAQERLDQNNPYYQYNAKKNGFKEAVKSKNTTKTCVYMCKLMLDKYFWFWLVEKFRFYVYR